MDFLFPLLLVAVVVIGPWILLARSNSHRQREREQDDQRVAELTRRLYELEESVKVLQRAERTVERHAPPPPAPVAKPVAPPPISVAVSVPPPIAPASVTPRVEPPPVQVPGIERPAASASPIFQLRPQPEAVRDLVETQPPGPMLNYQTQPTFSDRLKGGLDLEEALGANWLNKIGIVILVFGVAFFLAYQLRQVGPAGKVLVGAAVSLALLAGGIFLERKAGYRILGRTGIGGGWAMAFFTAYATYHVPAARIFNSQLPSLALMFAVAAGMVLHTLRYRSQVVTGLAFLLAFSTLPVSQVTLYSLAAGAVLALALVIVVGRMQGFELEIFGILAAYLTHWWWLRRIIEPMGAHKRAFPEFFPSAALLILYWAIFRGSYIWRHCDQRQEKVSTVAALLNSIGLGVLLKYQSVHPEWAFWGLLGLGAIEVTLGCLPITRRRRAAFFVLTTIGVTLLVAAIPFRYTGARLDVIWLLEAETLLLVGVFVREIHFRRLGMVASVLAPIYLLSGEAGTLFGLRFYGLPEARDVRLGILCLVASAVFFANSTIVVRRWPELFEPVFDRTVMHRFSFVGAVLLFVSAWAVFPLQLTAVAWAILGSALLWLGWRLQLEQLPWEAHFYFACSLLAALFTNLPSAAAWGNVSQRLVTVSLIAILCYLASLKSQASAGSWPKISNALPLTYRWSASLLLILLVYYALPALTLSPAWVAIGLLLVEVGFASDLADLCAQGYIALTAAFVTIFFVNLNGDEAVAGISSRLLTVAPVVLAMYYLYFRLDGSAAEFPLARGLRLQGLSVWCGVIGVAAVLRFEVSPDWVAAAWAALALVLMAIAWRSQRIVFLEQALLLAAGATFRGALHNLYERSYLPGPFWHGRTVCTSATAMLLFASLWFGFRLRKKQSEDTAENWKGLIRRFIDRPEQVFFFLPLGLVIALLAVDLDRGMVTVSWSALGVLVFLFALWVKERSFRLAGLGLLLLGVGKIIVIDVWELSPRDRYLTFITMGSALLLVSFLYSRYREAIRRYL